jgi:hypothetical protein
MVLITDVGKRLAPQIQNIWFAGINAILVAFSVPFLLGLAAY